MSVKPPFKTNLLKMFLAAGNGINFLNTNKRLYKIMGHGAYRKLVKQKSRFHVRSIIKSSDIGITGNINRSVNFSVSPQRKISQPSVPGGKTHFKGAGGNSHGNIKSMLKFNFAKLGQGKRAGNIGKRLSRKHYGSGFYRAHNAFKTGILKKLGNTLKPGPVIFKKTEDRKS